MQDELDLAYRNDGNPKYIVGGLLINLISFIVWLVFFILKLTNTITMSWFWVFFPIWIIPACMATLMIILSIYIIVFKRD